MPDRKIIVNKHYAEKSAITQSVFASNTTHRLGEIIICNSKDDPGIFIMVTDGNTSAPINVTSAENIKLAGYVKPDGAGSYELSQDDTVSEAFGKVVKLIEDTAEHAMPNTGNALSVDNDVLNVRFDNYTIKLDPTENRLYVDTNVVGGGGGGATYIPGQYIAIDSNNRISVTGITPSEYATTAFVETYVEEHGGNPEAIEAETARAISAETALQEGINDLSNDVDERFDDFAQIATATTEAVDTLSGRVGNNETAISDLQQAVSSLDPSNMSLISSSVMSMAEDFEVDGVEYEAGIYLVMTFGIEGDESTYKTSYSNIDPIINAGKEYLTESQYATLVAEGHVVVDGRTIVFDPNVDYYTFEDEEPEPEPEPEP